MAETVSRTPKIGDPNDVDFLSVALRRYHLDYALVDALMSRTRGMREHGETYLPREEEESPKSYACRKNRTVLLESYRETVRMLAGRPFVKPVVVKNREGVHEQIDRMLDDMDNQGTDVTEFSYEYFRKAIHHGGAFALVEYPNTVKKDGSLPNLKEERAENIHPYVVLIAAPDILGYRTESTRGGRVRLTELRYREWRVEDDGTYGDKRVEYVRVVQPGQFQLYRKDGDDWVQVSADQGGSGTRSIGEISLVPLFTDEEHELIGCSPALMGLADKNVEHWWKSSDRNNIEHIVSVAILFRKGWDAESLEDGITVGVSESTGTTSKDADMKYVEHTGKGIETLNKSLAEIKDEMELLGMQPLVRGSQRVTATAKGIDENRSNSRMEQWVRLLELSLLRICYFAAKWVNAELSDDLAFDVFSNFSISQRAFEDIKALQADRQRGDISQETYLQEAQRRGLYSDDFDIEEEINRTVQAPPDDPDFDAELDEDELTDE